MLAFFNCEMTLKIIDYLRITIVITVQSLRNLQESAAIAERAVYPPFASVFLIT